MNSRKKTRPELRFSPAAWSKLIFMRDRTDNEVGAFGITRSDELLFVTDIVLIKQKVTSVSIEFNDEAVADYFEDQVDAGNNPEQFARIWIHTHPGSSPEPSRKDEETFRRVFGTCSWAVMFIISSNGNKYARLRFNEGPGGQIDIPVSVDYAEEFAGSDFKNWKKQYKQNVIEDAQFCMTGNKSKKSADNAVEPFSSLDDGSDMFDSTDIINEIEQMNPANRQALIEEFTVESDFWEDQEGGFYDY